MPIGLQVERIESAGGLNIPTEELKRLVYRVGPTSNRAYRNARSEEGCLHNSCDQHYRTHSSNAEDSSF